MDDDRARRLLSGPRGRRFVAELLDDPLFVHPGRAVDWPADVRRRVAETDPVPAVQEDRLVAAVTASVVDATYWQEPYDVDVVLADDEVAAELLPLARAAAAAPATGWWAEPFVPRDHHVVAWPGDDGRVELPRGGADPGAWREATIAEEVRAQRERPTDPRASWSGEWWALPHLAGCTVTRPVPAALSWVEDARGETTGRSWPVTPPPGARVLEVAGPADWVGLVERFPLVVTASRRHDWWRVTGEDEGWVIPDWSVVADEYDAVHLTVDGYLATAGRALPVHTPDGPAGTVLAGWDPGTTWWLTAVAADLEAATDWGWSGGSWARVG
ncbi:hypothetical protein DQ237_00525 [Blastococcus sp. TF02-8]|uniref:hypothetical protein n=1 Tax=Blastococcus sp. TF02-8 TaxID=2250574 RepID=UPI000DE875B6|nr:hypothetical protein [Blastococcus sp. TF02-8]RBY97479.1 hypothetical protein DQ237_00525 [Blastococcus sp. TF02-8]